MIWILVPQAYSEKARDFLLIVINTSLSEGVFSETLRTAIIRSLLKKFALNKRQVSSYGPVSNLPFFGLTLLKGGSRKILEDASVLDPYQSRFLPGYAIKTIMKDDLIWYLGKGELPLLVQLDLSAAFGRMDH